MLILPVDKPFAKDTLEQLATYPGKIGSMLVAGSLRINVCTLYTRVLNPEYTTPDMLGTFLKKDSPATEAYLDGNNKVGFIHTN